MLRRYSCPVQNPLQPVPAKRRGTILSSLQVLHVLSMKQEITSKEIQFSANIEGYRRRGHQTYSAVVCRHLCIVTPNPNSLKKLFSSEECRSGARTSIIPSFLCCLDNFCLFEFFRLFSEDAVYCSLPHLACLLCRG